jgi:hypothetical protein
MRMPSTQIEPAPAVVNVHGLQDHNGYSFVVTPHASRLTRISDSINVFLAKQTLGPDE